MSWSSPRRRAIARPLAGVLASIAALLIWLVAVPLLDIDLDFTDANGRAQVVGLPAIIIFSVGSALAGWALLAILERLAARRALVVWTAIAVAVVLVSLLPLVSMEADAAVALGLMHLAVGAVIITVLRATSPVRSTGGARAVPVAG